MTGKMYKSLTILKELRDFIVPLSDDELFHLEASILKEGCREPLTVWEKNKSILVIVDGHNRYKICEKHGLPFKIRKATFNSTEDAKIWMVDNQIGRRNLTADQLSYYRGMKYLSLKKRKGGYEKVLLKGQKELLTSEFLANEFHTSESTIKRDAKFAEGLNLISVSNPKLKSKILTGEANVKKADILTLTSVKNPEKLIIKNEADLYNKAKRIRDEILDEVERTVKNLGKSQGKTQETLDEKLPVFLKKEDRLRRIKGMILSAINRAINNKDSNAIEELKKLIEKLAEELFE